MRTFTGLAGVALASVGMPADAQMRGPNLLEVSRAIQQAYPSDALSRSASVAALVELWVDEKGKVFGCQLLGSTGDEKLAKNVCNLLARFDRRNIKSATDSAGLPAISRSTELLKMWVMGSKDFEAVSKAQKSPDIELDVANLPDGARAKDVDLVLTVQAEGRISECAGRDGKSDPYIEAGCKSIIGTSFGPGRGPANVPMPYIASVKLRFSTPGT